MIRAASSFLAAGALLMGVATTCQARAHAPSLVGHWTGTASAAGYPFVADVDLTVETQRGTHLAGEARIDGNGPYSVAGTVSARGVVVIHWRNRDVTGTVKGRYSPAMDEISGRWSGKERSGARYSGSFAVDRD